MSVKADIIRDALGNITVQMKGDLDYANSIPMEGHLKELIANNPTAKITVDVAGIDFVGSSGICHFVETIHQLNADSLTKKVGLKNISSDFQKIFRLYSDDEAQIIWDEFDMDSSDTASIGNKAGRKRTFEN